MADEDEDLADFSPNEFDDLVLRDDLEQHYTGANSGDELDDEQEDADRHDIVARIMRSQAKKIGCRFLAMGVVMADTNRLDLKEFEKFLKICRKFGVLEIDSNGIKAKFTEKR